MEINNFIAGGLWGATAAPWVSRGLGLEAQEWPRRPKITPGTRRYLGKRGVKTLKFMKGSCIKLGSRRVALRCDVNMQYGRAEIFDRQYGAMLRRPPLSELTASILTRTTIEIQTQFIYLYTCIHTYSPTYIHRYIHTDINTYIKYLRGGPRYHNHLRMYVAEVGLSPGCSFLTS